MHAPPAILASNMSRGGLLAPDMATSCSCSRFSLLPHSRQEAFWPRPRSHAEPSSAIEISVRTTPCTSSVGNEYAFAEVSTGTVRSKPHQTVDRTIR
eukprot:4096403-Alexandrium_andersonii.AAC.2